MKTFRKFGPHWAQGSFCLEATRWRRVRLGDRINVDLRLQSPQGNTEASFRQSGSESDYRKLIADMAEEVRHKLGTARLSNTEANDLQGIYPADADARRAYFQGLDKLRSFDAPAASTLLREAAARESSSVAVHSALADAWAQMKLDPEAAREARTASDLAQRSSLPLEYVVLAKARADEMDKHWKAPSAATAFCSPATNVSTTVCSLLPRRLREDMPRKLSKLSLLLPSFRRPGQ